MFECVARWFGCLYRLKDTFMKKTYPQIPKKLKILEKTRDYHFFNAQCHLRRRTIVFIISSSLNYHLHILTSPNHHLHYFIISRLLSPCFSICAYKLSSLNLFCHLRLRISVSIVGCCIWHWYCCLCRFHGDLYFGI